VRSFRTAGFEVEEVWTEFDGQYMAITARLAEDARRAAPASEDGLDELSLRVRDFSFSVEDDCARWRTWLEAQRARGRRVVLWGGGSKAVAFLTTVGIGVQDVPFAVDINEKRHGSFISGTGQRVVSPASLTEYRPHEVIVMNPIYRNEIAAALSGLGLQPALRSVEEAPAD
jgi:hypothetical protein